MGRYYSGDIEGKFWFAVQSSDVGEDFGCSEIERQEVDYYTEDLEACQAHLEYLEETLGDYLPKFQEFFDEPRGYNDETLEANGLPAAMLKNYADWCFGKQLEECLVGQGYCSFTAEY